MLFLTFGPSHALRLSGELSRQTPSSPHAGALPGTLHLLSGDPALRLLAFSLGTGSSVPSAALSQAWNRPRRTWSEPAHHFRSHYLGRGLPLGQMALPFPKECPESPCLTFASAASLRGTRVTPGLHADGFHCLQL